MRLLYIMLCVLMLSGCASLREQMQAGERLMNTPFYNGLDRPTPNQIASFYTTNFPGVTESDKADMVAQHCQSEHWDVVVYEKEVITKVKRVLWNNTQIWPIVEEKQ